MDRADLEGMDRESLVVKAQEAGIRRARILTRPELIDELLRLDPKADDATLKKSRGFFGVARDLLARVVERGLHLPDAADRIRTSLAPVAALTRVEPQAVPTVTLAEIYAAQGHPRRAVETLERLLEDEPDHGAARALLTRLTAASYVPPPPPLPPEPEVEVVAAAASVPELEDEDREDREEGDELAARAVPDELAARAEADDLDELESAPTNQLADVLGSHDLVDEADTIAIGGALRGARLDEDVTIALTGGPPRAAHVEVDVDAESAAVTRAVAPECVVLPVTASTAFVWWRMGVPRAGAPFVVRVLVVAPTWDGPRTEVRDIEIDAAAGELLAEGLPPRAVVRAAIGFGLGDAFVPVAHAPLLEAAPRIASGPTGLLRWTLQGMRPVSLDDASSRPIFDALKCARAQPRAVPE
jgi:hypothetical protein